MAKLETKTRQTDVTPLEFLATIEHPVRRKDGETLLELFNRVTGMKPRMWGPTIVGYGRYIYHDSKGREGEFLMTGFSPRKASLSVYIMPGYRDLSEPLSRLGKHKTGVSCLYINKLADVDLDVLEEIILDGLKYMKANYQAFPE